MKDIVSLNEVIQNWEDPINSVPPLFPVVYFEILKAQDCRGFIELLHLAGDWDFSGYPIGDEDIIIDSRGRVFSLGFDRFVFPNEILFKIQEKKVLDYFLPAICASGDIEFLKEIISIPRKIETIVDKVARRFSW